ncbi:hypothetical protein BJ741DRAFT_620323, partial [Chytriomyces cf. hyalinus JEL632]
MLIYFTYCCFSLMGCAQSFPLSSAILCNAVLRACLSPSSAVCSTDTRDAIPAFSVAKSLRRSCCLMPAVRLSRASAEWIMFAVAPVVF